MAYRFQRTADLMGRIQDGNEKKTFDFQDPRPLIIEFLAPWDPGTSTHEKGKINSFPNEKW